MKKIIASVVALSAAALSFAGGVTWSPNPIQDGYTGTVTVTFDPSGTDMASQTTCYAHTGVFTDVDEKWQCAPAWPTNTDKYKLTKSGSKWVYTINNIYNFYSCVGTKKITTLNFVFRNSAGDKQSADYFIPVGESSGGESTTKARPTGIDEGIYYNQNDASKVTLCIYAASKSSVAAKSVYVLGDFNNWAISDQYKCYKDGNYFWLEISGLTPGNEYCFQYQINKADGTRVKVADPYSEKVLHPYDQYEPKQIDPSIRTYPSKGDGGYVTVLQPGKQKFQWSSATLNFVKPDKNNLVIYEMWIRLFAPNKSFKAVTKRLDYLKNLGVNAIELMPVTEFDGNISWGYNPTMYFAPDKAYGSENDLKELIDEAHKRGMAVILDMVVNHTTEQNTQRKMYTKSDNPWFNMNAPHSDSVLEDWNHDFSGTQNYFKRALKFWIDEYKVDGYRMDMSHGICGANCNNRFNIISSYYDAVKSANSNAYFILEHWDEWNNRGNYVNKGMMCWTNTTEAYFQTAMGWLKDGDNLNDANIDGYVTYCESHDEMRDFWKARMYGNGNLKSSLADRMARVPLNMTFCAMLNGPQMFYNFAELGYDYSFCTDANGTYGDTKEKNADGCKDTEDKPQPEKLGWLKNSTRMSAYQKIGKILQLRTRIIPSVFAGNPTASDLGSGKSVRSITWGNGNNRVFIVGNFNVSGGSQYSGAQQATLPTGNNWYDYLSGSSNTINGGSQITLQPSEVKIYTATKYTVPDVPALYDFTSDVEEAQAASIACTVYPTVTSDFVKIETEENVKNTYLVGFNGAMFKCNTDGNLVVDMTPYPTGWYLLVVQFEKEEQAFKVYKK